MNDFQDLKRFITESNSTNSTNDKLEVLERYKDNEFIKKVLHYTYSGFIQFYITPKILLKRSDLVAHDSMYADLFDLLDALRTRQFTGHEAISEVNAFINDNIEYKDLILDIIDRNLKNRIHTTLINKVIPNLIPTFDVALANKFDDKLASRINFSTQRWFGSRKLDGVRCIIIIDDKGKITTYSREGNEFDTLDRLKDVINGFNHHNTVLDGEICIVDENGNEDFQSIMKEINKKDHTIQNPKFLVFDLLYLPDFLKQESDEILSERYKKLKMLFLCNPTYDQNRIEMVEQIPMTDELFESMQAEAAEKGWEGIMIRKDVGYEGKRSNNLLKVKKFFDEEYTVTGVENGPFRVIVNGLEVTEDMLSNVYIQHKGCQVSVGSGFSIDERRNFYLHPEEIIGKVITVKYFQESVNQDGGISLRFPTIKALHGKKREV